MRELKVAYNYFVQAGNQRLIVGLEERPEDIAKRLRNFLKGYGSEAATRATGAPLTDPAGSLACASGTCLHTSGDDMETIL